MAEDPVRQQAQGLRARVGAGTHGVSKLWSRGGVGLRASSRSTQTPHHGGRTVKTTVGRLLTGVVALALLLGGFGLMQDTAQAQQVKQVSATSSAVYICTDRDCNLAPSNNDADDMVHDNVFDLAFPDADEDNPVIIQNLDLPRVNDGDNDNDGPDANPKAVTLGTAEIVGVHQSSGLDDTGAVQVKAFNGNRIQITFTPTGGQFSTIKTVIVDNVKPQLVTSSPDIPLIVTSGVDLTFSAEVTDGGSGYTGTNTATAGIHLLGDDDAGPLDTRANGNGTVHGGIRLVVAGNNVELGSGDFEKIDDGWRVTKTINSTAIQNISANNPWYFETKDRAGNVRRTSGSISGNTGGPADLDGNSDISERSVQPPSPTTSTTAPSMRTASLRAMSG